MKAGFGIRGSYHS